MDSRGYMLEDFGRSRRKRRSDSTAPYGEFESCPAINSKAFSSLLRYSGRQSQRSNLDAEASATRISEIESDPDSPPVSPAIRRTLSPRIPRKRTPAGSTTGQPKY